jgi:hypothetical protein
MRVTDIEAIAASGITGNHGCLTGVVDGPLWSNGNILVRGDYSGKANKSVATKWCEWRDRLDIPATLGRCVSAVLNGDRIGVCRELRREDGICSVWVNEAYLQAVSSYCAGFHIIDSTKPVTLRADGELVACIMPVAISPDEAAIVCEPTDDLVWGYFACAANNYHKLSREALVKRLAKLEPNK